MQGTIPNYQALLNQAQATTVTTAPPDPGFNQHLPYQPQVTRRAITLPTPDTAGALGAADVPTNTTRRTAEFLAGALLLGVLAMFALFLKRSADQAAMLEALVPGGAVAGLASGPSAVAGLAAGASASDDEPVVEPNGFDALLAETAPPAIDHSAARERRRTRWSERAARVAVALATDQEADGGGPVAPESPVARRFGLFPDARPRPASAPAVSEISLDDLPMFGRASVAGGAAVPEVSHVSEATEVPEVDAVPAPAAVPEMPPAAAGDHDPGRGDEVLPSRLLLVLRGGAGTDEEEAPPVGIPVPPLATAEPALAVAAPSIGPRPTRGRR